ncbi:MAG: LysR family transcriptional regulator [Myxococcales bacterium]|nr:LysR family transcriptional regulator [Polyangiaceae bacterium]MDW8248428.1 LysR family transcriptional regulator [Myxococcales bacterium]
MDLNHIVSFLRVVEAGSFTKAARVLGVPTSTVSRQVAQLEEDLGVRLLQRTSRHVQLTEAGVAYHERISPAVDLLTRASSEIHDLQETPSGLIRLTAPPDLSIDYLAVPLAQFSREYPKIQVELVLTGRMVDLVAEGFDLALRAGEIRDRSLIVRKIGRSEIILVASQGYLARRGEPHSLDDLYAHDCIGFRAQRGRVSWNLLGPEGPTLVELDCRISVDDFSFVRALLLADAGVALAPRSTVQAAIQEGKLRRVLSNYEHQTFGGISLVYPSAKYLPRRVALLRDYLLRVLPSTLTLP